MLEARSRSCGRSPARARASRQGARFSWRWTSGRGRDSKVCMGGSRWGAPGLVVVATVVALSGSGSPARADVVGPFEVTCPAGARAESTYPGHAYRCVPATCATSADCAEGLVCQAACLCSTTSFDVGRERIVRWTRSSHGLCSEGDCDDGERTVERVCVPAGTPVAPDAAPSPPPTSTSGESSPGPPARIDPAPRSARGCSVGPAGGAALPFTLCLPLLMLRRRSQ